jgi:hypothetical protein
MSDRPRVSKKVNYLFPLAEKELSAFVHAVDQLFGTEQARRFGARLDSRDRGYELAGWRSDSQLAKGND